MIMCTYKTDTCIVTVCYHCCIASFLLHCQIIVSSRFLTFFFKKQLPSRITPMPPCLVSNVSMIVWNGGETGAGGRWRDGETGAGGRWRDGETGAGGRRIEEMPDG